MRAVQWGDCVTAIIFNVILLNHLCPPAYRLLACYCVCVRGRVCVYLIEVYKIYCRHVFMPLTMISIGYSE